LSQSISNNEKYSRRDSLTSTGSGYQEVPLKDAYINTNSQIIHEIGFLSQAEMKVVRELISLFNGTSEANVILVGEDGFERMLKTIGEEHTRKISEDDFMLCMKNEDKEFSYILFETTSFKSVKNMMDEEFIDENNDLFYKLIKNAIQDKYLPERFLRAIEYILNQNDEFFTLRVILDLF